MLTSERRTYYNVVRVATMQWWCPCPKRAVVRGVFSEERVTNGTELVSTEHECSFMEDLERECALWEQLPEPRYKAYLAGHGVPYDALGAYRTYWDAVPALVLPQQLVALSEDVMSWVAEVGPISAWPQLIDGLEQNLYYRGCLRRTEVYRQLLVYRARGDRLAERYNALTDDRGKLQNFGDTTVGLAAYIRYHLAVALGELTYSGHYEREDHTEEILRLRVRQCGQYVTEADFHGV